MASRQRGDVFKLKSKGPDGKPYWAYRVREGGRGSRRVQHGGFHTKAEASAGLRRALDKVQRGVALRTTFTLADLADEFLAQYVGVQMNTRRTTEERLRYATRPSGDGGLGDVRLDRLTERAIARWRAALPEGSAWGIHKVLSQVLNYGVRVKLLPENPARSVRNPEPQRMEVRPFEYLADVDAVGDEMMGPSSAWPGYREIPLFAALTGLRPEEWIPLRRRDLDLKERVVHVRRVFTGGELYPARGKGKGMRRAVPLPQEAVDLMGGRPVLLDPDALLFPTRSGGMIDLANWRANHWNPAVEAAGLAVCACGHLSGHHQGACCTPCECRRFTRAKGSPIPYTLRHTYAAHMIAAGYPTDTLARYMGTSVSKIEDTYGHLLRDSADLVRRLADAYLSGLREREANLDGQAHVVHEA